MLIAIEATDKIIALDGVFVRVWKGTTEEGTECLVFVHRLAVKKEEDQSEFERELREQLPPTQGWNLRAIQGDGEMEDDE